MSPKRKKTLNVGVIGLGMGSAHLAGFHEYGRSNVVALCDQDPKRLAAYADQYGVPEEGCFTSYRSLFAAAGALGLEAVSVALPNTFHAPATLDAYKAGLHVLCEKPMAMDARQARAMLAAAGKARRKLMINFSFRFPEQSRALKRVVDGGGLGDIYFGRTVWHRRRGLPGFGGWFGQKKLSGGGPVIDLGVHRLDLAMWLMGNPRPVTVSAGTYDHVGAMEAKRQKKAFDVEDLGCALIRFDNGATIILEASWAGFSEKQEDMLTQLYGTRGGIVQRNLEGGYGFEAIVYTERDGSLWEQKFQQSTVAAGPAYAEFTDAVLDDREPLATGQHGLDVQLILDAIYRSARLGKEIRIRANG